MAQAFSGEPNEAAATASAGQQPPAAQTKRGATRAIGRAVNTITGASYYKRSAAFALERAKLPLLRRVISTEYHSQRFHVDLTTIKTIYIEKTLFWQRYLFIFYSIAGIYSLLSISRGLAAGLRYDMWGTSWLWIGLGLLAFSTARGAISYKVIKSCSSELKARKKGGADAPKEKSK